MKKSMRITLARFISVTYRKSRETKLNEGYKFYVRKKKFLLLLTLWIMRGKIKIQNKNKLYKIVFFFFFETEHVLIINRYVTCYGIILTQRQVVRK